MTKRDPVFTFAPVPIKAMVVATGMFLPLPHAVRRRVLSWISGGAEVDDSVPEVFRLAHRETQGPKVGRPRMKSRKDHRQSFRLTRNGFSIRGNGRLYVAKVGEVRVRWSRELPSAPSSVTIIREPDGHYYASFVVDVPASPLPLADREAGLDLGITR